AGGQVAAPVTVVVEQGHAAADGKAGEAAVERIGGDDGARIAVRLHLNELLESVILRLMVQRQAVDRCGVGRERDEESREWRKEKLLHTYPRERCAIPSDEGGDAPENPATDRASEQAKASLYFFLTIRFPENASASMTPSPLPKVASIHPEAIPCLRAGERFTERLTSSRNS